MLISKPLPHVLTGPEREAALRVVRANVALDFYAQELAKWARRDPSLFLEDSGRAFMAYEGGTLLDDCVWHNRLDAVRAVLEAGVHPDDRDAFQRPVRGRNGDRGVRLGGQRLVDLRKDTNCSRIPGREMLALALEFGADPDGDIDGFKRGVSQVHVRRYAMELEGPLRSPHASSADVIDCVRMLLNAEAVYLDSEDGRKWQWRGLLSLIGASADLKERPSLDSEVVARYRDLAQVALDCGAALNHPIGDLPQPLWMARDGQETMACILVELGAAEEWELPPDADPESCFTPEGRAQFREALMRRRLQLEAAAEPAAAGHASASATRRRGARL